MNERDIFIAALAKAAGPEREGYLEQACAGDADLRRRVEALIEAHERAGKFLESADPAFASTYITEQISERPGTVIGPYRLLEQIGEGGFGVVFMAEQTEPIRRKVAVKVIKPGMDTRQVIARFEAERQALALMDHPHIARVFDAGSTESGRPYFVMELVKGISITQFCDQHQLTVRERLELFVTVCQAAQHAHQKGIIHRDIKPSNVLVTLHDDRPVVKVIDFGVAKATSGQLTDKTLFTGFMQMLGTPLYMSPEQTALSGIDIDTRSDIYSLGVLLYELLTGTTPFSRERLASAAAEEILRIIREEEPDKPSSRLTTLKDTLPTVAVQRRTEPRKLGQLIQGDLDWIVMKSLEKDRKRRYETANEFAHDVLNHLADQPVVARAPSFNYLLRKFAKRNWRSLAIVSGVMLALLIAAVISAGFAQWALQERNAAKNQRRESQRNAALEKFERIRLTKPFAGWSDACKTLLNDAVRHSPHPERRNYAAAMMQGTDVALLRHWTDFDARSVGFHPDSRGVIAGAPSSAKVWTDVDAAPFLSSVAADGPVLFVEGKPHQLRLSERQSQRMVELVDVVSGTTARQCLVPGDVKTPLQISAVADNARLIACAFQDAEQTDGSQQCTVVAWDGKTGAVLFRRVINASALALSPQQSLLAIGTESGLLAVVDLSTGKQSAELKQERLPIRSLAFHRDFRRSLESVAAQPTEPSWVLAAGTAGGRVCVWDLLKSTPRILVSGGNYDVHALAFNPDGTLLASTGRYDVRLWDASTGRPVLRLNVSSLQDSSRNYLVDLAFSSDGNRLAAACVAAHDSPGGIDVWKFSDERPIHQLRGLAGQVEKLVFSKSGKLVAALTQDWQIGVWDRASARLIGVYDVPPGLFADNADIAFDPTEQRLAYSTFQHALICDLENGAIVSSWELPPGLVDRLSYVDASTLYLMRMETKDSGQDPDSRTSPAKRPRVTRIRNLLAPSSLKPLIEVPDHNVAVVDACVAGQGNVFVIHGVKSTDKGASRSIIAVDASAARQLWSRPIKTAGGGVMVRSNDSGAEVALCTYHSTTASVVVDALTGAERFSIQEMPNAGFTHGAAVWATWHTTEPGLRVLDGPSAKQPTLTLGRDDRVTAGATFSGSGVTYLSWGNAQGEVYVCDLPSLQATLRTLDGK